VYSEVLRLDLSDVPVIRWLFTLRSLPARLSGSYMPVRMDLEGLARIGFVELARVPDQELTLGLIAKFWSMVPKPETFAPAEFAEARATGAAKAAWTFLCHAEQAGTTLLTTQTRVKLGTGSLFAR
jgi:hypothetical protein